MTTMVSLDTSTNSTGFAVYDNGELSAHFVIESSGRTSEEKIRDMIRKIYNWLDYYTPKIIVIELTAVARNVKVQRNLTMILGAVLGYCINKNIYTFFTFRPTEWRSLVCGDTKPPKKREELKQWSKDKVKEIFKIELDSDDIADAILIGYAYIQLCKGGDEE